MRSAVSNKLPGKGLTRQRHYAAAAKILDKAGKQLVTAQVALRDPGYAVRAGPAAPALPLELELQPGVVLCERLQQPPSIFPYNHSPHGVTVQHQHQE